MAGSEYTNTYVRLGIAADNPHRHLLFRRGYFASVDGELPDIRPDWKNWREADFGITYDPLTPFTACRENGSFLALLGHVVSLESDTTEHAALARQLFDALLRSEKDFLSQLDACCGRFVCFFSIGNDVRVLGDATGMKMIHYTTAPARAVASHAAILAMVFDRKKSDEVAGFLAAAAPATYNMAFLPGHATWYDDIRILVPNTHLDLRSSRIERFFPREPLQALQLEEAVEQASTYLSDLMGKFSKVAPLCVSLTAGLDSRLTTAAAAGIRHDVLFFSYVRARKNVNLVDAVIARLLAETHGLEHMQLTFDYESADTGPDREDYARFRAVARHCSEFEHFHPLAYAYCNTYPAGRLHMRSNIGEICRARYYTPPFESIVRSDDPEAEKLAKIHNLWTRAEAHPYAIAAFDRYLKETGLRGCPHGFDLPSLYYWEHLMPVWHGALLLESDLSHDTVCLFNCRRVLTTFLSMAFEAQRSREGMLGCIRQLWPQLLDLPINPKIGELPNVGVGACAAPGPTGRLEVQAWRDRDTVRASIRVPEPFFAGETHYAFYLLAGKEKIATRWYTRASDVVFELPEPMHEATLAVRGFIRSAEDHAVRFSIVVAVASIAPPGGSD